MLLQYLKGILAAALATLLSAPLLAADDQLQEIIVTARRIPESLAEVPLAIDVFARDKLVASSIDSLQTLIARAPGLYFESTWGGLFSAPNLRGQQPSPAGDVNVGVFVDGVYQASEAAMDPGALDLERIEVARGPQTTLFGHSTFAGAIHYVSRQPADRLQAGFAIDAGSNEYRAANGFVTGPLFSGSILGRLALGASAFDGTQPNSAVAGGSLGGWNRTAAALSIATPGDDDIQARLGIRFNRFGSGQPAASALTYADYNCGGIESASGSWSYFCGGVPIVSQFDVSPDLPDSENDVLQSVLNLSWPLARGRLESQTGFYHATSDAYRDYDLSSDGATYGVCTANVNCAAPPGIPGTVNRLVSTNEVSRNLAQVLEWSQEFRWTNEVSDRLQWMVGATAWWTTKVDEARLGVARGDLAEDEYLTAVLPATPLVVGPLSLTNFAIVDDPAVDQQIQARNTDYRRTLALFGMVDYSVTEQIRTRAELRFSRERREVESAVANFAAGFGNAFAAQNFNDFTPRFSIQFQPSNAWNGYISAAKGSQSGGINTIPGLSPHEQSYAPEYNWTYELNARFHNDESGLAVQATMYYIDWRDAQVLGFPDTPGVMNLITQNTKGIYTRGLELSLDARLLPALRVELDLSYADPAFRAGSDDPGSRRFCGISGNNTSSTFCTIGPARSGNVAGLVPVPYIDGNLPARTPREMWHAGMIFTAPPMRRDGRITLRVDANGQDDVYERAIDGARFGSRSLLDTRLSYQVGNWSIALWGRNLTDYSYVRALASRGQIFFPTTPRPLDMIYADGRRIGLSVSFSSSAR